MLKESRSVDVKTGHNVGLPWEEEEPHRAGSLGVDASTESEDREAEFGNGLSTEDRQARPKFITYRHTHGDDYSNCLEYSALILGDAHQVLAAMPAQSVQTVVTSPPYWSLRDYGIEGQIGLESSVFRFVDALVGLFDEVWKVLRSDGTLWLNIGDSYTSGGRKWRARDKKNGARAMSTRPNTPEGLKPKDLIGVPWRLALALQERGWYLRSDIIWNKPNAQPESVGDRPTRSHEYLFLLSKSERYKFDVRAVRGPNDRRIRTVWDIQTQWYPEASGHFATFPLQLVDPCIQLSTEPGDLVLDPFLGSGTTALCAALRARRFVGVELSEKYLEIARNRLLKNGLGEMPASSNRARSNHA